MIPACANNFYISAEIKKRAINFIIERDWHANGGPPPLLLFYTSKYSRIWNDETGKNWSSTSSPLKNKKKKKKKINSYDFSFFFSFFFFFFGRSTGRAICVGFCYYKLYKVYLLRVYISKMETISSMNPLRPLNLQRSSIYVYLYLYIYLYLFILFLFVFLFLSLPFILPYSRPFILVTIAFFLQTEMIDRMTRYARVQKYLYITRI